MFIITQVNNSPYDNDWFAQFDSALKSINAKITDAVGEGNEFTNMAINNLNSFISDFKFELSTFYKTLNGKAEVSDLVKEATKQWQVAINNYEKELPEDLSLPDLTKKFEYSLKNIAQVSDDLFKKANGNIEIENDIKEFAEKQINTLMEHVTSIHAKVIENKVEIN